ncbi:Uncharacterized protein QTN25_007862 [Entamoeba marina]
MNEATFFSSYILESYRLCKTLKNKLEIHMFSDIELTKPPSLTLDHDVLTFHLLPSNTNSSPCFHYYSLVDIHHSICDEWKCVQFFLNYTKTNNSVIELFDEDGQLLLAQCAEIVPSTITPENDAHRIFIYNGCVYFSEHECLDPLHCYSYCKPRNDMTTLINDHIHSVSPLFESHRTIAFIPQVLASFLNDHTELFGLIINKCIDEIQHNNTLIEGDTTLIDLNERRDCQLLMSTHQFNKYYNYIMTETTNNIYRQQLGDILIHGFTFCCSTQQSNDLLSYYKKDIQSKLDNGFITNDQLNQLRNELKKYITINDYSSMFLKYKTSFIESITSNRLIEDPLNTLDLNNILAQYRDILNKEEFEKMAHDEIDDMIGLDSDVYGVTGRSDRLNIHGILQDDVMDTLYEELLEDLNEEESTEENDANQTEEEIRVMKEIGEMVTSLNLPNNSMILETLEQEDEENMTTTTMLNDSMK